MNADRWDSVWASGDGANGINTMKQHKITKCCIGYIVLEYMGALKRAQLVGVHSQQIYLLLVYLVTALVPSETACLANSPGRRRRTAVWISLEVMVDLLL